MRAAALVLIALTTAAVAENTVVPDPIEDARLAIRTKQFEGAVRILQEAAQGGSVEADYLLGLAALNGIGLNQDADMARESLRRAAGRDHARAAFALAALLASDPAKGGEAAEWLDRSAAAGYAPALSLRERKQLPLADARLGSELGADLRFEIARYAARGDNLALLRATGVATLSGRRDAFGRTLLFIAAESGARVVVRELLKSGFDAHAADEFGITPLMLAATQPHEEITLSLLAAGAHVGVADNAGRNALFHATAANHPGQVRRLLAAGAPLAATDLQNENATDLALRRDATAALQVLRDAGGRASPSTRLVRNGIDATRGGVLYEGWPAIAIAAARDDAAELRRRAAAGESIVALTPRQQSPLRVAADAHAADAVLALLELGADPRRAESDERSALQSMARSGDPRLLRVLLARGALTGSEYPMFLAGAIDQGDPAMVRTLLGQGASANEPDDRGDLPLTRAARLGDAEMIKLLLDRGATPGSVDARGRNALWHAAAGHHRVAVDLLLSVQPAVDSADRDGVTPLVAAIRAGDVAVVRRLLDAGAAAMGGSQRRNQPMRAAAEHGDVEILEALLSRRVDVDAVDEFGDTALIVAARGGHAEMCMKLLAAGANGRLRGRDRLTAAEVAEARGFTMLAQRLRS